MQVDLQVEVPKGFELTGEYRPPKTDEFFLNDGNTPSIANIDFVSRWLILRKVDTWRDATLDDLKRVMDGETVECRVSNNDNPTIWLSGATLAGWISRPSKCWRIIGTSGYSDFYDNCQVKE